MKDKQHFLRFSYCHFNGECDIIKLPLSMPVLQGLVYEFFDFYFNGKCGKELKV